MALFSRRFFGLVFSPQSAAFDERKTTPGFVENLQINLQFGGLGVG